MTSFLTSNPDAMIAASHACLTLGLVLLCYRLVRTLDHNAATVAVQRGFVAGAAMLVWLFAVERAYYFAARVLRPGYDLWSIHPAPLLLSTLVFASIWAVLGPLHFAHFTKRAARRRITVELFGFVALWVAIVVVLS